MYGGTCRAARCRYHAASACPCSRRAELFASPRKTDVSSINRDIAYGDAARQFFARRVAERSGRRTCSSAAPCSAEHPLITDAARPRLGDMSTRRWMGELEKWMRRTDQSKADVARRSKHSTAHVLALFDNPDPNPSLQLYLDVVGVAGGRFSSVRNNTPAAVIERLKEIKDREKISTVALSKKTGITRPMLSTLLNDPDPNPSLLTFDRIVAALNAEEEFHLVNILARTVRLAIAAGATNDNEVLQVLESTLSARPRHLQLVPEAPASDHDASRWAERERRAEQERRDAEERLQEANGRVAELCERCSALQVANVALEKQHADTAAELRRLQDRQRRGRLAMFGVGVLTGLGLAAGAMRARR